MRLTLIFAVYLFSQSIEYLCHILTKKYLTRFYEKEKKTYKIIGKSMVRCTSRRFLDVKIQPGKGGGGGEANSKDTSTREGS